MYWKIAVAALVLFIAPAAHAQQESWVGKTVLVKKTGVKLMDENGKEIPSATIGEMVCQVRGDRDGRLRVVTHHGVEGWFDKNEAVPADQAVKFFSEMIEKSPKEAAGFYGRAVAYRLGGEFDLAIKDCGEVIRLDPRAHSHNIRGNCSFAKKDYDKAIEDYSEAIKLDGSSALLHISLGIAFHAKKDLEKAIENYTEAIKLDPKYARAYFNRGLAYQDKQDFAHAIEDYSEAIRHQPSYADAYHNRGTVYHAQKDYDKAVQDYTQALQLDPQALQLDPRNARVLFNRGLARQAMNDDRAFKDFSDAIELDPNYAAAYLNRADIALGKLDYDQSIADFDKAIHFNPKEVRSFVGRGRAWFGKQEFNKAMQDLNEAIKLDPKNSAAYLARGRVNEAKSIIDQALQDYTKVVELDPHSGEAFFRRAHIWELKKDLTKAIGDYSDAIALDSLNVRAYQNRALAQLANKQYDKAIKDFTEVIQIEPKNFAAFHSRGVAYQAKKDFPKAGLDYAEAYRIDPNYVPAYKDHAWLLATCPVDAVRNGKLAVELATKAVQPGGDKNGTYCDTLAAAHAEAGQFDEAVRWEKTALEDMAFAQPHGDAARQRLELYTQKKPYREGPMEKTPVPPLVPPTIPLVPPIGDGAEILWELREHSAGLNCGRWDYIFSFIKKFHNQAGFVLPDRALVTMDRHFLRSYVDLLIRTCHRRGIHAMGGMAAQIPIKNDPERNRAAIEKVRQDKLREVWAGHDGTWVAHPGWCPLPARFSTPTCRSPTRSKRSWPWPSAPPTS